MYKLAIFDMDGTTLNTIEDLCDSVNFVLKLNNFPPHPLTKIRQFVGNGVVKLIERAAPSSIDSKVKSKLLADFYAYYRVHCTDKTTIYDGVKELLIKLKDRNVKLALLSNKPAFAVHKLCNYHFYKLFDKEIGGVAGTPRKPSPIKVNELLAKYKITRAEAVMVGDSEVDILTAKNAKIASISVLWGFKDKEFLIANNATYMAKTAKELEALLLK